MVCVGGCGCGFCFGCFCWRCLGDDGRVTAFGLHVRFVGVGWCVVGFILVLVLDVWLAGGRSGLVGLLWFRFAADFDFLRVSAI